MNWIPTIGEVLTAAGMVGTAYYLIVNRINKVDEDLQKFKLQVARENVTTTHLKELELRLITSVEKLSEDIKDLRNALLSRTNDK